MTAKGRPTPRIRPHVLREYALIADGERGAVVGPHGEIAWLCVPQWHSGAVFATLIGGDGFYQVRPVDDWFTWGGSYRPGTLIWHSRWTTPESIVECHEALAFPGDEHRAVLCRRIVAVAGRTRMLVRLRPRSNFGQTRPRRLGKTDGVWTCDVGRLHLRWSGAAAADVHDDELTMVLELDAGRSHDLVLEVSDRALPDRPPAPDELWESTAKSWQRAVTAVTGTLAPGDVRHSYAVLRGLTARHGGMVAAATTSLPERAGVGDYDYRYAWIRDQCVAGLGIAAVDSTDPLVADAVRFVAERLLADGPALQPAYTVNGDPIPRERTLPLPGYPGGADRVGNKANDQFQLDTFGEALLLFAAAAEDRRTDDVRQAAAVAIDTIRRRWQLPDAGIWELDSRHWTHSRLICAAGLRAIARIGIADPADCAALADRIVADTAAHAVHPNGFWRREPGSDGVDAALLLPALRGALPADDPRSTATRHAVHTQLTQDGYVYRFRHDERALSQAEGAFLLCGFQLAMAEHQAGNRVCAARLFERNRAACGPPGLYTEEYDVIQRQLRGNLPQAFVHGAFIEAAARLSH